MTRSLSWGSQDNGNGALAWESQENTSQSLSGSAALTLDDAVLSAAGERGILGSVSETLEDSSLAAGGSVGTGIGGALSEILDDVTAASTGTVSISGTVTSTTDDVTSSVSGLVWERVVFVGPVPDYGSTESFHELAFNDLGFSAEVGDVLHYTPAPGLTVDGQFIPTVSPAADVSGTYYIEDVSEATSTAKSGYTIDQRISGETGTTLGDATLSAVGGIGTGILGSLGSTLEATVVSASGSVSEVISGTLTETLENASLSATGTYTLTGTLSETLASDVPAATGDVTVSGTLAETLESDIVVAYGAVVSAGTIVGSVVEELESATLAASGTSTIVLSGDVDVTLEDVAPTATGVIFISGSLSETLASATSTGQGSLANVGQLSELLAGDTLSASGTLSISVSGSAAITLGDTTMSATGDGGISGIIITVVDLMKLWLPPNNTLTDEQMQNIVRGIIQSVGATDDKIPEILCKALKAAALLNKAHATTSFALSKEKIDRVEYGWTSGGKSPKDLWQDYIDELPNICPLFGYDVPSAIGISVNSGPAIDPLLHCKPPSSLY